MKKTGFSKSNAKKTKKYTDKEGLVQAWIHKDLKKLLKSGIFGDTIKESSINLVDILKERGLY